MPGRIIRPLTFALERLTQRGIAHRLMVMAALVALAAVLGGIAAWIGTTRFVSLPEAIW